ncbi:hypothetical protein P5673_002306 [Acropora cervicornis]|uniref:HECT domain-containing protein n=1 Tax=Acropora cervicornis TaxID=6130 RepID=A0AAD9VF44_ACRCE|nr:hypothetical protein P5673_002306 [Acropora cervicornis]
MAAVRGEGDDLPARCISLLQEVKDLIEARSSGPENTDETAAFSSSERQARSSSSTRTVQQQQGNNTTQQRVMQNFRSLYAPYSAACSSSASARPPAAKKPRTFQVRETWTHDFFCLGSTQAVSVPSRAQKITLQNAGLGRRKVVFSCKGTALDVKTKLESVFPKLKAGGGFELLRSGSPSSKLSLITPPSGGYSVAFLRDAAGLGQALAYIRPLQKDLDMLENQSTEQVVGENILSVKCLECEEDVALATFRQHQAQCNIKTWERETLLTTDNSLGLVEIRIHTVICFKCQGTSSDGYKVNEECSMLNTEDRASLESQLMEMFPGETPEKIQYALLQGTHDLSGAAEYLLNGVMDNKEDEDEDNTDWNTPLSAWGLRKLDYQEALMKFVSGAVQSHLPEEHLVITRDKSIITQELVRGKFNGIKLFEGEAGHLVPSCDYDLVSSCFFVLVGKMVVHSFINECKGLEGISPAVISYVISGSRDTALEHLVLEDIPDPCLRQILKEELGKFTSDGDFNIADTLVSAGFPHIEVLPSNRSLAYECVLTYEVVTKRIPVLDDLRKGLDSVRVMATTGTDLVQQHPQVQQLIFPAAESKIEVSELRQLIKYNQTDGSTAQAAEYFEKYLDELNTRDEETLGGLLQLWTGWPSLTMIEEKMTVAFLAKTSNKVLAEADTCFKSLKIPTYHTEYENFVKYMDLSISHGKVGFGKM